MKKCKFCQTEISAKAKVCPNCKRNLKSHGCLTFIFSFIIICIGVAAAIGTNDRIQKDVSGVSDESEYITMEEYKKIENGMTYEEVVEIVGSEGELSANSSVSGYTTSIYTWYGNGVAGSNANVTFQNGKATGKAQVGLK